MSVNTRKNLTAFEIFILISTNCIISASGVMTFNDIKKKKEKFLLHYLKITYFFR